jgi:NAD(P)H-dependent FMN reductase
MPAGMQLTIAEYGDVPLFNQDVQNQGIPDAVTRLARLSARPMRC